MAFVCDPVTEFKCPTNPKCPTYKFEIPLKFKLKISPQVQPQPTAPKTEFVTASVTVSYRMTSSISKTIL